MVKDIVEAPPSLDYVPVPEHPPLPDYVPGAEEPEQAPLSPCYPLPTKASPTTLSPGYVADFDPEEDPEEDPKEDPTEYLANGGDDDYDDDDDDEEDGEEEEHLAPAYSTALHTVDPISSAEDTEAFKTDESAHTPPRLPRLRRARISVRPQTLMVAFAKALIAEYVAAPTPPSPPPSPLIPLSSLLP
ncbi:hypothetical protein Tco_0265536 [Tanacetum coccineum]